MSQLETDIIVVAAGASGLPAAITAAQGGAKVIVFEKGSTTGGTGNMGMGPFGVESRLQRLKQVRLTRDEAFKIFMDYTHWRVDAQLVIDRGQHVGGRQGAIGRLLAALGGRAHDDAQFEAAPGHEHAHRLRPVVAAG